MKFAGLTLELDSPLHVRAGRAGMAARCRGFLPGHVLTYALATTLSKALGGRPIDFAQALEQVRRNTRCGPLFILGGKVGLCPRLDQRAIETRYLTGGNHATRCLDTRSAVENALFEVEAIAARVADGPGDPPRPVRLDGGMWFDEPHLQGKPLPDWLRRCRLGGELKAGCGQVRLHAWAPTARAYAGRGRADGDGLHLTIGETLPGPALDGVGNAPLEPWTGRAHDPGRGFDRRFSAATDQ